MMMFISVLDQLLCKALNYKEGVLLRQTLLYLLEQEFLRILFGLVILFDMLRIYNPIKQEFLKAQIKNLSSLGNDLLKIISFKMSIFKFILLFLVTKTYKQNIIL